MRTGAVATLSIMKSAKTNFESIGCIGLGNTCEATLDILLSKLGNRELTINLKKYKDHHNRIIKRYKNFSNIQFHIIENTENLINKSDVLLSCITSVNENIGKDEWYQPGITVIPVHTMGFQNCDLFFDKFIIDDYEHVKGFKYFNKFKETIELQKLTQIDSVRETDQERIIAYNVGIALHDVYFAYKVFELLYDGIEDIMMESPQQKFWM